MSKKPLTIKSNFAILGVTTGRAELAESLKSGMISVTLTGYIVHVWGADDGMSREFQVDVTGVQIT